MVEHDHAERLAALEARLAGIEALIARIDGKLDAFQANYVPRAEITEMFRSRDERIERIEEDDKAQKTSIVSWAGVVIAGLAFAYSVFHK